MACRFSTIRFFRLTFTLMLVLFSTNACTPPSSTSDQASGNAGGDHAHEEAIPRLAAADLADSDRLQVVATTSIIADVVGQVGGEQIGLTALFPTGADAHSYEPTPQDIVTMSDAHVIFVNGLGLEASLEAVLSGLDGTPVVAVNAGVETAEIEGEHDHGDVDPHTWFSIHAVAQWTTNVAQVLGELDPGNIEIYEANAAAYLEKLDALETELDGLMASLPANKRKLVTDHEALGYLAAAYDLEIIGSVIPSLSSMASPSARDLAALQAQIVETGVPAIFVGVSANTSIAAQIAQDSGIEVVPIYVGALSEADGPAPTYLDLMRHTVSQIVEALQ